MSQESPPHARPGRQTQTKKKPINTPKAEDLTAQDLAYYRQTWGFDPIKDRQEIFDKGVHFYRYEFRLPLEYDPPLKSADVQVIARVEFDSQDVSHNRLGFIREHNCSLVECIHTAIYDATPEDLADWSPEDYESLVSSTEGCPAILPPWEHFASLKSFAAGLVDRGILSTIFGPPGVNEIYDQLVNCLYNVAPDVVKPLVIDRAGEIIEQAEEKWVKIHAEPLYLRYNVNLLFGNRAFLASIDNSTLKKILILFLKVSHSEFSLDVFESAGIFFTQLGEGNFLEELTHDPEMTQDVVDAINKEIQTGQIGYDSDLENVLVKIYRILFTREDPQLCNPRLLSTLLSNLLGPFKAKNQVIFGDFDKNHNGDFLFKLLETVFQIWEKEKPEYLGDLPLHLIQHFVPKDNNLELLNKFLNMAPDAWLAEYWSHLNDAIFAPLHLKNKSFNQDVRKKIKLFYDFDDDWDAEVQSQKEKVSAITSLLNWMDLLASSSVLPNYVEENKNNILAYLREESGIPDPERVVEKILTRNDAEAIIIVRNTLLRLINKK